MSEATCKDCGSWQAAQCLFFLNSWRFLVTARRSHQQELAFCLFKSCFFRRGWDGEQCTAVALRVSVLVCFSLLKKKNWRRQNVFPAGLKNGNKGVSNKLAIILKYWPLKQPTRFHIGGPFVPLMRAMLSRQCCCVTFNEKTALLCCFMSIATVLTELMPVCARGTAAAPCSASLFLLTIISPCH